MKRIGIQTPCKALCMGGVFAVSTVIPGKIQRLAIHLGNLRQFASAEVLEYFLQVLGCFLVLSVLIWATSRQTAAGIPTPQQGDRAGPWHWSGGWRAPDADVSRVFSTLITPSLVPKEFRWHYGW